MDCLTGGSGAGAAEFVQSHVAFGWSGGVHGLHVWVVLMTRSICCKRQENRYAVDELQGAKQRGLETGENDNTIRSSKLSEVRLKFT